MFDGSDYVGKTTQLALVSNTLERAGQNVYHTRYNGGTPIGEALRQVMLGADERPPMTDLYINLAQQYAAAGNLEQQRKKGSIVLVDRSPLSIIAYQVHGGGVNEKRGYEVADEVMKLLSPDLIIFYQAPEEVLAMWRKEGHDHPKDFFESKSPKYFQKVAEGYQEAAEHYNALTIEASGTIDEVHKATMQALEDFSTS